MSGFVLAFNSFPHTAILQQMTLIISWQKHRKCLQMKLYLLNKVENLVAKEEITHNEQFLRLPQWFHKKSALEAFESVYMWERVWLFWQRDDHKCLYLQPHQSIHSVYTAEVLPLSDTSAEDDFWNHCDLTSNFSICHNVFTFFV